jgi:hypothetical protein
VVNSNPDVKSDEPRTSDTLARLLARAEQGDRSVLPELRAVLDANADLWRHYGDLAAQAEAALIAMAAGSNLLLAKTLQLKLKAMKDELASESPLERLLVERVSATWLQVNIFDGLLAQANGVSEARLKILQRQQDAAHRRHLTAIRTLATVKKLLTPTASPLEIATRLEGKNLVKRRGGVAIAGTVPVQN